MTANEIYQRQMFDVVCSEHKNANDMPTENIPTSVSTFPVFSFSFADVPHSTT